METVSVEELPPFLEYHKFSHPLVLNEYEFIIVPANGKTRWWSHCSKGIFKYNIKTNKWSLIVKYPSSEFDITMMSIALKQLSFSASNPLKTLKQTDIDTVNGYIHQYWYKQNIPKEICRLIISFGAKCNELYMFCDKKMVQVDLDCNEFFEYQTEYIIGDCPGVVFVDNAFHIVGGRDNSKHIKYDMDTMKMETIYDFKDEGQDSFCNMGLLYISTQNVLILFGGYNTVTNGRINSIWRYSFDDNIWIKCMVQLENGMNSFGYILTNDEKYIVIFGGVGGSEYSSIYVLDVVNMKWRNDLKKELEGKHGGICCAVLMPNDEIFVVESGFRSHFKINVKDIIQ